MTSTYQFKLPNAKFMVSFINIFVLAVLLQSETVNAFSPRSLHRPSSILTSQTQNRYNANSSSSLKATGQNNLVAVTDSNYRALFGGEKFLLLDAYAQWCGPCKLIEPVLEQCAEDWKDSVVVGKFDVEDANSETGKCRDLKVELILQGVMPQALPALILVHKNKILDTWKGVISPTELQEMLEKHVVVQKKRDNENRSSAANLFRDISVAAVNKDLVTGQSRPFRGIGLVNNF